MKNKRKLSEVGRKDIINDVMEMRFKGEIDNEKLIRDKIVRKEKEDRMEKIEIEGGKKIEKKILIDIERRGISENWGGEINKERGWEMDGIEKKNGVKGCGNVEYGEDLNGEKKMGKLLKIRKKKKWKW